MADEAARQGTRVDVADVCAAAVAALPVNGAGLSALSGVPVGHVLCATDEATERLEELQFTLGEGPCVDAFTFGGPVLTSDLRAMEIQRRWPAFAAAASKEGAGAVFALPLQIGAIRPGVLDLYRGRPGGLNADALADALVFADTATRVLLDTQACAQTDPADGTALDGQFEGMGGYRAEIDQATGMLTEQLGVGIDEAFIRLRAYAYAYDRRLAEVARAVVSRRLRLSPDPDPASDDA
ncbi:GAF and ANTAR domain-containing protein [Streptomyces sp. 8N616]|uniref:GAF and ANTAR domain-containing protein n=1 Tax=Streptomyces sp. 8N616 TaxID=3457414 RepID=UPI003FD0E964